MRSKELAAPPAQVRAGQITTDVLRLLRGKAVAGAAGAELDAVAERAIRDAGGIPAFKGHQGFSGSICFSVNEQVVHGVPGDRKLKTGDLVSLDVGVKVDGYFADSAITLGIGKLPKRSADLLAATEKALAIAFSEARDGQTTGDLGAAVEAFIADAGFAVVRDCVGHGIGKKLHQDPSIPNFGGRGKGSTFKAGMVVAIEPMIVAGDHKLKLADDKWTLSTADGKPAAHVEETVLITKGAPVRLTPVTNLPDPTPSGSLSGKKAGARLVGAAPEGESR